MNRFAMQSELFPPADAVAATRVLLADLHDDLEGKVARYHQLVDLSTELGLAGTMLPGAETTFAAWAEARSSFVHGNYVATILLCQGLAEHLLAAHLAMGLHGEQLPNRIAFSETLKRCVARGLLSAQHAGDLRRLAELRNPLSHYRSIDESSNLSRRVVETQMPATQHLLSDATFAIGIGRCPANC